MASGDPIFDCGKYKDGLLRTKYRMPDGRVIEARSPLGVVQQWIDKDGNVTRNQISRGAATRPVREQLQQEESRLASLGFHRYLTCALVHCPSEFSADDFPAAQRGPCEGVAYQGQMRVACVHTEKLIEKRRAAALIKRDARRAASRDELQSIQKEREIQAIVEAGEKNAQASERSAQAVTKLVEALADRSRK